LYATACLIPSHLHIREVNKILKSEQENLILIFIAKSCTSIKQREYTSQFAFTGYCFYKV